MGQPGQIGQMGTKGDKGGIGYSDCAPLRDNAQQGDELFVPEGGLLNFVRTCEVASEAQKRVRIFFLSGTTGNAFILGCGG